ncbi:MAG: hypothetical protein BHV65_13005 [Alistipes sp. 58_9_plus]|nr:MAG: hypothetical protein BHV65_13005 [Alistipes sp. 58_9_plus]
MLKIYMRLLGFARPIQKYAIPYFFYSLLYALFNSLTFLLIMPILKTMFDADYTFVYVERLPPLAFNQEYLTALFNYTYSHLFNEYNPENVLLMLAVVTIFVSLLSNLFRYLGSWTVENMRTRTLQRMRNEMFSKVVDMHVGFFSDQLIQTALCRVKTVRHYFSFLLNWFCSQQTGNGGETSLHRPSK